MIQILPTLKSDMFIVWLCDPHVTIGQKAKGVYAQASIRLWVKGGNPAPLV